MPRRNYYRQRVRDSGEQFLMHLCNTNNFRETWDRGELTQLYHTSPCHGHSFSRILYHMSRYSPRLLKVIGGTTVHFKRPAADDFYWNEVFSTKSDLEASVKCNLQRSTLRKLKQNHFVCEVYNPTMPCTLNIKFTSNVAFPQRLIGFTSIGSKTFLDNLKPKTPEPTYYGLSSRKISIAELRETRLLFQFYAEGTTSFLALIVEFVKLSANESSSVLRQDCAKKPDILNGFDILTIPGIRPELEGMGDLKMTRKLEVYAVPKYLTDMFNGKKRQTISCFPKNSTKRPLLVNQVTADTHAKKFSILLHLEELQYIKDIKHYKTKATFQKNGCFLMLEVPGLAERRPSILRGDRIFVKKVIDGEERYPKYEGFVHRVEQTKIQLKFDKQFHEKFIANMLFSIIFQFNRNPMRLMHRAVQMINEKESMEMLFPRLSNKPASILPDIVTKDRKIERNEAQLAAVKSILQEDSSRIYLIYGPPGTGKTVTMVESILQTLDAFPDYHILVCAPSNSACDLLIERLLKHTGKTSIHRLNAPSRRGEIPESIREVSNINRDKKLVFRRKEELMKFKVIVCTLITAGRLASAEFPNNHFKRIFIDESGQSMEPELLVAVSGILSKDGKLILAGDPKQLGPIVRSPIAKTKGLQLSLLERLMSTLPYQRQENGQYNSRYVTKLTKNYRSHEAIVKLPNEEFYDSELEVCADEMSRYSLSNWEGLPKRGFPIIFKHVEGKDEREENSPSFFNIREVDEVKKYVTSLLEERRYKVRAVEIGVITPYRKQVQKIRKALNNNEIKIGSVEEFQGQERRVIIISTVRSQEENLKHDAIFHLGFVADAKRFNVAITRAKSLLIIVGNAKLLCKDKYWRKMYDYCRDSGGYVGPRCKRAVSVLDTAEERFSDDAELNVEDMNSPEWRLDP